MSNINFLKGKTQVMQTHIIHSTEDTSGYDWFSLAGLLPVELSVEQLKFGCLCNIVNGSASDRF